MNENAYQEWRTADTHPWPDTNGARAAFAAGYQRGTRFRLTSLWMVSVLILILSGLCANAAVGDSPDNPAPVTSATVFEWDAVTKNTDGEPVTVSYLLAAFEVGNTNMVLGRPVTATSSVAPVLPPRGVTYELRVKAISTDGLQSPWSEPLYITRAAPGLAIGKPRIKP